MEIVQIADTLWRVNGERIYALTREEAIAKYWAVRSQT